MIPQSLITGTVVMMFVDSAEEAQGRAKKRCLAPWGHVVCLSVTAHTMSVVPMM